MSIETSGSGLLLGALSTFAWRGWRKERTVEVSTACVQTQVRTQVRNVAASDSLLGWDDIGSQPIPV
jgi:endo-1,4-beta-D-glucanase Y